MTTEASYGRIRGRSASVNAPIQTIPRVLDLEQLLERKFHFLLGPRQTGKSFLIRHALPAARVYDLLDHTIYLAFSRDLSLGQRV